MGFVTSLPVPSARMGMMWSLSSVKGLTALEFGPAGTSNYLSISLPKLNARKAFDLYTTHISEKEIVLGDVGRLKKAVEELERRKAPDYIFLIQSAVAAVIGMDLAGEVRRLQKSIKARLVYVPVPLRGEWTLGVERALVQLAKELPEDCPMEPGTYNIIGSCIDEFQYQSDANEVIRMMGEYFGFRPNCVMTGFSSIASYPFLGRAQWNLVLRREGIEAAKILRERFGTPWFYFRPYGKNGCEQSLEEIERYTGRQRNREAFRRDREEYDRALEAIELLFRAYKPASAVVGGNRDMVEPMCGFLKDELRIGQVQGYCNSKRLADDRYPFETEPDCGRDTLLLGDGLSVRKKKTLALQVSNPNYDRRLLYGHSPFLGMRGAVYLMDGIYRQADQWERTGRFQKFSSKNERNAEAN